MAATDGLELKKMTDDFESKENAMASSFWDEFSVVLRLGWPNSVSFLFSFIPGLALLSFLGSNSDHLAAAGMGFMWSNVSGISMIMGFGAGAAPLISQAHGASNFVRCGDLLQRQIAIHMVVILVVTVIWMNTEEVLLAFKQPPGVAKLTAEFMRWRVVALPFLAVKEDLTNYLVAQRVMITPMAVSIVANVLNILLFPVLIDQFGFIGAPLTITLANVLHCFLLSVLTFRALPHADAWPLWRWSVALSEWGEILKISMPSMVMMLSEWWGWEINLFFAGMLCDETSSRCVELEVFPVVSNTMVVGFMTHIGFSIAAGTHVGNALGEGDPSKARRTSNATLLLVSGIAAIVSLSLVVFRWNWAQLFSIDTDTIALTAQVLPLVAAYIFFDALGPGVLMNLLRAMGLVRLPAVMNFVSFYVIGIPFGLYLTFVRTDEQWGIFGLWAGLVLAMFIMVVAMGVYLCWWVDLQEAADVAQSLAKVKTTGVNRGLEQHVVGKRSYLHAAPTDTTSTDVLDWGEDGLTDVLEDDHASSRKQ